MKIKLLKLVLENFKGTKYFELNTNGKDTSIYGDNETGKTTVADAFYWLLFNKNSHGDTKFAIKTLDNAGNEIHNLNHSVYGVLEIDGKEHHIKKVYKEKWTQKRGQPTATFSGHETTYELGSSEATLTPKKLKEFTEYIKSIVDDENIFKLVTNPLAFNSLKPNDRKDILMSLVDVVTDDDVINSDKKLADLKKLIGDGTLEEFKMRVARDKKAINDEMKAIPTRIDEINHNMPDINKLDLNALTSDKAMQEKIIESIRDEINQIKSGNNIIDLKTQLKQYLADKDFMIANHDKESKRRLSDVEYSVKEQERKYNDINNKVNSINNELKKIDEQKENLKSDYANLKAKYQEKSEETKEFKTQTICECCGQDIPEDIQQEAIQKMQEQFNLSKSTYLESIKEDIEATKKKAKDIKEKEDDFKRDLEDEKKSLEVESKLLDNVKKEFEKAKSEITDVTSTDDYKQILVDIADLETKIKGSESNVNENVAKIEHEKLDPAHEELKSIDAKLYDIEIHGKATNRIAELEAKQKELAKQFEELEHAVYLSEEFTKAKVNLMESTINSKFKMTKFKLFDVQINGGINDVCEATYNGVPFDSGLNTAHRINVGLDIINALSEHYSFYAPIFIDNAEGVTDVLKTESQQIKLHVSEQDKTLRVEEK